MTRILSALAVMAALVGLSSVTNAAATEKPVIVASGGLKWIAGTGPEKGLFYAPLYGDPHKAGTQYAYRLKIPGGTKIPPHVHGRLEQLTVVSGTFLVGFGTKWDASKMIVLGPGSFSALPANVPHYAFAKTDAILEFHGVGPESMTMLKPKGKM